MVDMKSSSEWRIQEIRIGMLSSEEAWYEEPGKVFTEAVQSSFAKEIQ